ncbi:Cell wall mannoprotein 1 [Paramyrothecium foliicola]|nr:Cell wall mannoprotein 1 [Paramyrothecium foliicola]
MSATQQGDVTFGVELEFHVELMRDETERPQRSAEVRKELASSLAAKTGLPIAAQCAHESGAEACSVCEDAPRSLIFEEGRYFYVQHEGLIEYTYDHEKKRTGLEISTPIFPQNELAAGLPQLSQLVAALGRHENDIVADKACGLHIHVGLQSGMTLLFAKKLVTVVLLLERPLLLDLVPVSRSDSTWAGSITTESMLGKRTVSPHWIDDTLKRPNSSMAPLVTFTSTDIKPAAWNDSKPQEFQDTVRLFWEANSLENMSRFLRRSGVTKLGLAMSLRDNSSGPHFEGGPSTFEFRYPQMSFHLPFIRNWVAISCRIAEIAALDHAGFRRKTKEIVNILNDQSGPQLREGLLTAIGLEDQLPEWRAEIQRYKQDQPFTLEERPTSKFIIIMRFLLKTLLLTALPSLVISDGASIIASIDTISTDTLALNETVSSWNGGLLGTLPIIIKSTSLLENIKKGTEVASASANLTLIEAIQVAQATRALAADVNSTLETIIAAEGKFDRLLLGPVILLNLKLEKDATEDFSGAVTQKVPESLRGVAELVVRGILQGFDKAIDVYGLFKVKE